MGRDGFNIKTNMAAVYMMTGQLYYHYKGRQMKSEDLSVFVLFLLLIFIILISLPLTLVWQYLLCISVDLLETW